MTAVPCLVLPQLNGCISTSASFIFTLYERNNSKRTLFRETLEKSVVGWPSSTFVRVDKIFKPKTCPVGPEMKASIFTLQIYTVLPSHGMENSRNGIIGGGKWIDVNTGDALCVLKSEGSFRVKNRD